jgi:uncharacterized damage-inducible protein DinB
MKAYFIRLFNYDKYANGLILQTIAKGGNPEKEVQLMGHLLAAQQVWLNRCLGLPQLAIELWPAPGANPVSLTVQATDNYQAWTNYLDTLDGPDFEKIISYHNTKGTSFKTGLSDIITHVINHGTHHRAQIGQHLKLIGVELPNTDYIGFVR